jgi:hypothetical protein
MKNSLEVLKQKGWIFVVAIVGAFALIPQYFENTVSLLQPSAEVWASLDTSWVLALSYVSLKQLQWGTEFVFTYGPLSFLSTRVGWGQHFWSIVLFDVFVFLNFSLIFYFSIRKAPHRWLALLLVLSCIVFLPNYLGPGVSLALLAFLVFWIRLSLDTPKHLYFAIQTLILFLLFFIKFNTGLISFVLFYAGLIYLMITQAGSRRRLLIWFATPLILIWLGAVLLNVAFVNYIFNGLQMVTGFNDIMHVELQDVQILVFSAIILGLCVIFLLSKAYYANAWLKPLTVVVLFSVPAYVLYKQAFVRADAGHIFDFFTYLPLFVLVIPDFARHRYRIIPPAIIIMVIALSAWQYSKYGRLNFNYSIELDKKGYAAGASTFKGKSPAFEYSNFLLPDSIRKIIGNSTVDVYPWNIQLLLENRLNYSPRPVIQSYTAYTPELEELNFKHYNSDNAPDFVLYDFVSIDNRYPLFDEPKVNLVLLKNYKVVDTLSGRGYPSLLLQKKVSAKPINLVEHAEYALKLGHNLSVKPDTYYQLTVYHSISGTLYSLARHAPNLELWIRTKDNVIHRFKTGRKLLESGLFFDTFLYNSDEFRRVLSGQMPQQNANIISSISIHALDENYFGDLIRVKEFKIQ